MDSWVAKYWHKLFSEKEQAAKYCHPHCPPSSTNKPTSQVLPPPPQPNTIRKTLAETTHRPACAKIPPLPPPLTLSIWKWVTQGSFFVSLSSFSSLFHPSPPPMRPPPCPSSSPLSTLIIFMFIYF
jgi:hypothetical protein